MLPEKLGVGVAGGVNATGTWGPGEGNRVFRSDLTKGGANPLRLSPLVPVDSCM